MFCNDFENNCEEIEKASFPETRIKARALFNGGVAKATIVSMIAKGRHCDGRTLFVFLARNVFDMNRSVRPFAEGFGFHPTII